MKKQSDIIQTIVNGIFASTIATLAACGGGPSAGPCDKNPPAPTCNQVCSPGDSTTCPSGYHCRTDAKCYAFCTVGGSECGDGLTCTDDGKCIPGGGPNPGQADASTCPAVNFTAMPTTPSIQLVLDRSGSMKENFGNGMDRWEALKDSLIGATGVVTQLQAKAYFGASIYPGDDQGPLCDTPEQTSRALNAQGQISQALQRSGPNGPTPTASGVNAAVAGFVSQPPPANSPKIIVLATDGDPNGCNGSNGNQGQQDSVAAATAAHAAGIDLYVLSVARGANQQKLQQVANAGLGTTNATVFLADDPAQLKAAFDTIIGGVVSCQLNLSGQIDASQAAAGTVSLNGRNLMFGTEWRAVDGDTIELIGAACTELKSTASPSVTATFPCGVAVE